jgi:hypothetical protein
MSIEDESVVSDLGVLPRLAHVLAGELQSDADTDSALWAAIRRTVGDDQRRQADPSADVAPFSSAI